MRAKVEHPFLIVKRDFGFTKTRYRGIAKNLNHLHMLFASANWLMRARAVALTGAAAWPACPKPAPRPRIRAWKARSRRPTAAYTGAQTIPVVLHPASGPLISDSLALALPSLEGRERAVARRAVASGCDWGRRAVRPR